MRQSFLVILLLFITISSSSQPRADSVLFLLTSRLDTALVEVKSLNASLSQLQMQTQEKEKLWIENNGPWVIALIIGLLTILANVILNRRQQIAQLRVTLKSKNRQDWIIELRDSIAEFTTQCKMINIEFQDKQSDEEKKKPIHEKITHTRTKLALLLNPKNAEHKPILDSISELLKILDDHFLKSKHKVEEFDNFGFMLKTNTIIELGTQLSYDEWQKIQKLEK